MSAKKVLWSCGQINVLGFTFSKKIPKNMRFEYQASLNQTVANDLYNYDSCFSVRSNPTFLRNFEETSILQYGRAYKPGYAGQKYHDEIAQKNSWLQSNKYSVLEKHKCVHR